jgi:hypothetical protein
MASFGWLMKINFLRGFLFSHTTGNKPPSRHEAKIKRHRHYIPLSIICPGITV